MAKYIKTHSNYVLKKKHQTLADGTVYERDITTINGLNQFAPGQTPIYKSSNFIITVGDDSTPARKYASGNWEENSGGEVWTAQKISEINSAQTTEENSLEIVLKQDFYDLKDFAYFGSCSELVRASISNIVKTFPGEMYWGSSVETHYGYVLSKSNQIGSGAKGQETILPFGQKPDTDPGGDIYYTGWVVEVLYSDDSGQTSSAIYDNLPPNLKLTEASVSEMARTAFRPWVEASGYTYIDYNVIEKKICTKPDSDLKEFSASTLYSVVNPYFIDIHSPHVANVATNATPLKWFANDGYKNYEIIPGAFKSKVTRWSVEEIKRETEPCPGDLLSIITANNYHFFAYLGNNANVYYLYGTTGSTVPDICHMRPLETFWSKYYQSLDGFERLLMNPKSNPKYTASFQIVKENDFGYYTEIENFTMPIDKGGYNIDFNSPSYTEYVRRFSIIAAFYDERFCDNLYRTMVHESIKNSDWSYINQGKEGDEGVNAVGTNKIHAALEIMSREFDEIKSYIDTVRFNNAVTYDERSNTPDYMLTDLLEGDGWDLRMVYPLVLTETTENGDAIIPSWDEELSNTTVSGKTINRTFSQDLTSVFTPYKNRSDDGYFLVCDCDTNKLVKKYDISGNTYYDECAGVIRDRIVDYFDTKTFSAHDINNEFLRRLKLNSRTILRHKGTIEGVEMLLSLFGLKSRRWVASLSDVQRERVGDYDYEINEYTQFTVRETDPWDCIHDEYKVNWINSTKAISYNNLSTGVKSLNNDKETYDYQGLLVAYRDDDTLYVKSGTTTASTSELSAATLDGEGNPVHMRYLYPYFDKKEENDGNVYYQMNGGWLPTTLQRGDALINFAFDKNNFIVSSDSEDEKLYTETLRDVGVVDNLAELLSLPYDILYDNVIYYVNDITTPCAIVDGTMYNVEYTYDGIPYIPLTVTNHSLRVGDRIFKNTITVYDKEFSSGGTSYSLATKANGFVVKAFINTDGETQFIARADRDNNVSNITSFSFWSGGSLCGEESSGKTHYFILEDMNEENARRLELSGVPGWRQLAETDYHYRKLNTIIDNFKGNNPHTGHMHYDAGHEYFLYFKELFKYALDTSQIDTRCYENYARDNMEEVISQIGFSGLVSNSADKTNYDKYLISDEKVHAFCSYKEKRGDGGRIMIYQNDPHGDLTQWKNHYGFSSASSLVDNASLLKKTFGSSLSGWENYEGILSSSGSSSLGLPVWSNVSGIVDNVTSQIVNNKRIDIVFYINNPNNPQDALTQMKYVQDVILPYTAQMIPSAAILGVRFKARNE